MTNKKKIILTILSCLFIAIACIFGFTIANKQDLNVKADSVVNVYTFSSSNIYSTLGLYSSNNQDVGSSIANVTCSLVFDFNSSTNSFICNIKFPSYVTAGSTTFSVTSPSVDTYTWLISSRVRDVSGSYGYFKSHFHVQSGFNFDVRYVSIFTQRWGPNDTINAQTVFKFYDSNDVNCTFYIFANFDANSSTSSSYYINYSQRYYYYSTSLTDNQYFNAGVEYGKSIGENTGFNEGYAKAIEENKSTWEQTGYNNGIRDANDYTFLGLIGATIDAPISALFGYIDHDSSSPTHNQRIGGFFNFELLGVNLKDFFFAVLTFAVVLVIVRFAIGK